METSRDLAFHAFNTPSQLTYAIPEVWRKQLKANGVTTSLNEHYIDLDRFSLHLKGKKIYTDKTQSKLLCETLSSQISSEPTAIKKYNEIFNTKTFLLDWDGMYSLPFKITKLREFQYKYFTESVTQMSCCSNLV